MDISSFFYHTRPCRLKFTIINRTGQGIRSTHERSLETMFTVPLKDKENP